MYQQNSPFQNALPYLLLVALIAVAFLIYKNNPAIMVPEPYFKTILKKKELASMSVSFGGSSISPDSNARSEEPVAPGATTPDLSGESKSSSNSLTPLRLLSHRWSEAPSEEYQPPTLTSKDVHWQLTNTHMIAIEKKQISAFGFDGQLIWQFKCLPDTEFSPGNPAIQGNMIFAATRGGHVYGIQMSDGQLVWFYKSPVQFLFSPIVYTKKLLLAAANANNQTWSFITLNVTDGAFLSHSESSEILPAEVPTIYKYSLGVVLKGGKFKLINIETGATLWRAEAATNFVGPAYFVDDMVFLSDESGLLTVYDWESGQKINEVLLPSALYRSLQYSEVSKTLLGASIDGAIVAVDLKKSERLWHHSLNMAGSSVDVQIFRLSQQSFNQLQFASKVQGWTAWATCNSNYLCIYDLKSGLLLSRLDLKGRPIAPFRAVELGNETPKPRIFVPLARGSQAQISALMPFQAKSTQQK